MPEHARHAVSALWTRQSAARSIAPVLFCKGYRCITRLLATL
jgi:hypothetical protein